jgi:hypothetical protein
LISHRKWLSEPYNAVGCVNWLVFLSKVCIR